MKLKWEREGERESRREGMIAALLAHEFQRESYDWQSHAAGLCVHTSHCTAVDTHTHVHTQKHTPPAQLDVRRATNHISAKQQQKDTRLTDTSVSVFLKKAK